MFQISKQMINQGHNILGIRWRLKKELGLYCMETINTNYQTLPWKGVVQQDEIVCYLNKLGSYEGFLHTDHKPVGGPCYHGNPIKGWQDWVKVTFGNSFFMCQILIFLEVTHVNNDNTTSLQVGKYALVHLLIKMYSPIHQRIYCMEKNIQAFVLMTIVNLSGVGPRKQN